MDLSIVIVSWNAREAMRRCLQSIYHYTQGINFEVWVVDNASSDGSATMVSKQFPQVHLIANNTNRGFGAANNQALALATGEYVLVLNDDTEIHDNIFLPLIERLKTDNTIGTIGCTLLNTDGSVQPSVRRWPTVWDQTIVLLKLHHLFPQLLQSYLQLQFDYTKEQAVPQVMGAFMLLPKTVLDKVGLFDEQFFTWFEEVDLQRRIWHSGYTVLYTPLGQCTHVGGVSFKQWRRPYAQVQFNKSMAYYFKKNHSWLAYAWIRFLQPISVLLAYVAQITH